MGPDRYALTWLDITNYSGLDITARDYHRGGWKALDMLREPIKLKPHTAKRNGSVPGNGVADNGAVPLNRTKTARNHHLTIPSHGNNECLPLPTSTDKQRIVGKKGRSGRPGLTVPVGKPSQ